MSVITLTTDFGNKDHYVGSVKGALFKELDNVNIVDISHNISPFNIVEAAYIIENSYKNFPDGSIHIIGIDSEKTIEQSHLVIKLDNHFFICANNGIMSLLASNFWNPVSSSSYILFFIIGIFFSLGVYLQIIALSMARASIIQPFHYTLIFWAIILGYIFYNDIPDLFTIVGAVIITLSGIFVLTQSTKS